jgi:hypothetical protein
MKSNKPVERVPFSTSCFRRHKWMRQFARRMCAVVCEPACKPLKMRDQPSNRPRAIRLFRLAMLLLLLALIAAAREAAMENFIAFAEITSAIIAAIGLALGLEWLSLNWLMRMMPQRHGRGPAGRL